MIEKTYVDSSTKTASSSVLPVILPLVIFLAVIIVLTIASFCTSRVRLSGLLRDNDPTVEARSIPADVAIDEEVLRQLPKLVYSQAKLRFDGGNCSCSVCLGDYGEGDLLRLLPDCGHVFHLKCVDPWLRLHRTCPLCRGLPHVVATGHG